MTTSRQSAGDSHAQERRGSGNYKGRGLIQKREVLTTILTTVGTVVVVDLTTRAVNAAMALVKDMSNWDQARLDFTQATTKSTMDNNTDPAQYVAAACYKGLQRCQARERRQQDQHLLQAQRPQH